VSRAPHLQQGEAAEALARDHLQHQGLKLLQQNYRCRGGEIDLVMEHGDSTVFVEVRYRRSTHFGSGAESVDYRKQQKLIHAANHYLQQNPKRANKPARFDVISIHMQGDTPSVDWIRDAFQAA